MTLTQYYITLTWDESADKDLPVIGYQLERDDGYGGDYITIYNGKNFPNVRQYTASGLIRGLKYNFRVMAINFNGPSDPSSELSVTFCNAPTGLDPPTLLKSTNTSLTLQWTAPEDDGGCPVTEYALYRDDGTGTSAPVDTLVGASDFSGQPSLREYTITFSSSDTGSSFKFQLTATAVSTVTSEVATFVVAATPDTPTSAPTSDTTVTTGSLIKVDYAALSTSENGGSDITSYELQIYNITTSTWISLIGTKYEPSLSNTVIVESGIEMGETYAFRYRAWNINGAGSFSDISYLVAAEAPSQPSAPEYVKSNDTSITLSFTPPSSDGGSIITNYILEYSLFETLSWNPVTTYTDNSMSHTLDVADGLITSYYKYRFRISAENAYGTSDPSSELVVAVAALPSQLTAPQKDADYSTKTSMYIYWDAATDIQPVTGYLLYMKDIANTDDEYAVVYDGSANAILTHYIVTGLTSGHSYGFKVQAINFNGEGEISDAAEFDSCEGPTGLSAPTVVDVSELSIIFSWTAPTNNGGCNITGYALLMDDGASGTLAAVDSSDIENKPYLRRYTKIFTDSNDTGKTFRFRLKALNSVGYVLSPLISLVLANEPDTPTSGPAKDEDLTTEYQIAVTWDAITGTGGSPIISYELQMSPPDSDTYYSVVGYDRQYLDTSYTVTVNITQGKYHKFIYRAKNAVGWSKFSPVSYIRALTCPIKTDPPVLVSHDSVSLVLDFTSIQDSEYLSGCLYNLADGSTPTINNYLYVCEVIGNDCDFAIVDAYDNSTSTYTLRTGKHSQISNLI